MRTSPSTTIPTTEAEIRAHRRRVLFSSYLGSVVEYYDFLLYGLAASLVFGPLFFANMDPAVATIASFGTLAIGYVSRPLGGVIFGHFGDRVGRKSMLVITMTLMGVASTLIGLLPTYDQIGNWAPLLLIFLRLLQGVAVGGEWGGAALMTLEHSESGRRGFAASVTHMGGPSGALLATLVMTGFSTLPQDQFFGWGWRVPFLLSAVLLVVGLFVRMSVSESPVFAQEKAQQEKAQAAGKREVPILTVLRHHRGSVALLALGSSAAFLFQSLLATFAVTLAVTVGGADRTTVLLFHAVGTLLHIFTIPTFAALSDKVGRRPVMISGAVAGALFAYPMLQMLASGSAVLILLAFIIGNPIIQASMYGPMAAFMGEAFGTGARYTGASLGYQLGSTLGAGLAPLSAASLLALGGGSDPSYIAAMMIAVCIVSGFCLYRARESYRATLHEPAPGVAPTAGPNAEPTAARA
ncbi:MFS transporter [Georgenia sp. AZ-5]|uniref:MFS transporter n=1 Tax=Georgenia sp. AZ-5 TaxID=3367526 RepID=UPI0037541F4B